MLREHKMNKRFCMLIFIAVILVFASSCTKTNAWEPTKYDDSYTLEGVNMAVKEETVSPTGLTVIIENNSVSRQFVFGEDFLLEKRIKDKWYHVPVIIENYAFNSIGYELAPKEKRKWTVDWPWLYGNLDAGE